MEKEIAREKGSEREREIFRHPYLVRSRVSDFSELISGVSFRGPFFRARLRKSEDISCTIIRIF